MAALTWACPGTAQDEPRPINPEPSVTVHQFGILRSGGLFNPIGTDKLLDLPDFVHSKEPTTATAHTWLDFSATYFHLPQMTTAPVSVDVIQGIEQYLAFITNWYPYVMDVGKSTSPWDSVYVGMAADGLETDHETWMAARRVMAAPLKVYKPGPPGTKPDDVGTTEGDAFLFLRGQARGAVAMAVHTRYVEDDKNWTFSCGSPMSDVQYPLTSAPQHMWIAQAREDGEIVSRRLDVDPKKDWCPGETLTSATVMQEPYAKTELDLVVQLNEAFAGSGLQPEEAAAQANLVVRSVRKAGNPVLIYMLGRKWIDARMPLRLTGPVDEVRRVFAVVLDLPLVDHLKNLKGPPVAKVDGENQ